MLLAITHVQCISTRDYRYNRVAWVTSFVCGKHLFVSESYKHTYTYIRTYSDMYVSSRK